MPAKPIIWSSKVTTDTHNELAEQDHLRATFHAILTIYTARGVGQRRDGEAFWGLIERN